MKIKISIALSCVLLLLGICFRQSLSLWFIDWRLQALCEKQLKSRLSHDGIEVQGSQYVISNPRLTPKRARKKDSAWSMKAEQALIGCDLDCFRRQIDLDLQLVSPQLRLGQSDKALFPLVANSGSGIFRVKWKLHLSDGEVELVGSEERIKFDIRGQGSKAVDWKGSFDESFEFSAHTGQGGMELDLRFKEAAAAPLFRLAQVFSPTLQPWRVSHGTMDGQASLKFDSSGALTPLNNETIKLRKLLFDLPRDHVTAQVSYAQLHLLDDPSKVAELELDRGTSLNFYHEGQVHSSLHELQGKVEVEAEGRANLRLKGLFHQGQDPRHLILTGSVHPNLLDGAIASLQLRLESESSRDFVSQIFGQAQSGRRVWKGEVSNLRASEWNLLQASLGQYLPSLGELHMRGGAIDASFEADCGSTTWEQLTVSSIFARDLEGDLPGQGLHFRAGTVAGSFGYTFGKSAFIDGVDSELALGDGHVSYSDGGEKPIVLRDFDAHLAMDQGVVKRSEIKVSSGTLQANLRLSDREGEAFHLQLVGDAVSALPFVSEEVRAQLGAGLKDDQLTVLATGRIAKGLLAQVSGNVQVHTPKVQQSHVLHFGFELARDEMGSIGGMLNEKTSAYHHLVNAMDLLSLRLRNGWFWGREIPVEKYVSPFAFRNSGLSMTGRADCQGSFEGGHVTIRYNARDIALDAPHLWAEVPQIGKRIAQSQDEDDFVGVHHIDFARELHYGFVPLEGATINLTDQGVIFKNCSGAMSIESQEVFINHLQANAHDVDFTGKLRLDLRPDGKGTFNAEIHTQKIEGAYRDVAQLLDQFSPETLTRLPIEGRIICDKPAHLQLLVRPEKTEVKAQVQGALRDGRFIAAIPGIRTDRIESDFSYDHQQRLLDIHRLQGRILVGDDLAVDDYTLRARNLRVYGFPHSQADFDIRVEGRTRDLVRLVGNSAHAPEFGPGAVHLVFNRDHTHVGTVQPNISELVVKDWSQVLALRAEPTANFGNLIADLQRFARCSAFPIPEEILSYLRDYALEGELIGQVAYEPEAAHTSINLHGDGVSIEDHLFSSCQLAAKCYTGRWVIEEFLLDDLSLATDIRFHEKGSNISFFGLRYGDSILAGLEGEYHPSDRSFEGLMNVLEVDLANASKLPSFPPDLMESNLQGKVQAKGTISAKMLPEAPFLRFESKLEGGLTDLHIFDVPFHQLTGLNCHFTSDRGVSITHAELAVKDRKLPIDPMGFLVERVDYDFKSSAAEFDRIRFRIPAKNLDWLSGFLGKHFSNLVSPRRAEIIQNVLSSGTLQGAFSFDFSPTYRSWRLELPEGDYTVAKQAHHIRDLVIEQEPSQLRMNMQYLHRDHYYKVNGTAYLPQMTNGTLVLGDVDRALHPSGEPTPLELQWEWTEEAGFEVKRAEGEVAGFTVQLHQVDKASDAEALTLGGGIQVDARKAMKLVPREFAPSMERWQLGRGLEWNGKLTIDKENYGDISLEGVLGGHDFEFMGYIYKSLFAHVDYKPGLLEVRRFKMSDVAGEVSADLLRAKKNELEDWEISAPLLAMDDFRPSLRQPLQGNVGRPKPLLIKRLELLDFKGTLGDPYSFSGNGTLSFMNPSKANIQNTILAIPNDILARIGLDLDLLTPVVGTVFYEIGDSRIYLNQFKDMWSEGRVSRFYLAEGATPSYLDFDGHLNVRVRMKQYNLIFKLAELFTISVRGELTHPTYSLQKQPEAILESHLLDGPDAA